MLARAPQYFPRLWRVNSAQRTLRVTGKSRMALAHHLGEERHGFRRSGNIQSHHHIQSHIATWMAVERIDEILKTSSRVFRKFLENDIGPGTLCFAC